jgi:hypothetical protein
MPDKFIVRWQDVKIVELLLYENGSPRRGLAAHQDEQEGNKEEEERKEEERSVFVVRNGWTPPWSSSIHRKRYCGNMSHGL